MNNPKRFDMKKPCVDCPFVRKEHGGFLGEARAQEISDALLEGNASFTCHKTLTNTQSRIGPRSQNCAGAMVYVRENGNSGNTANSFYQIAHRLRMYSPDVLDGEHVITDPEAFIEYHS